MLLLIISALLRLMPVVLVYCRFHSNSVTKDRKAWLSRSMREIWEPWLWFSDESGINLTFFTKKLSIVIFISPSAAVSTLNLMGLGHSPLSVWPQHLHFLTSTTGTGIKLINKTGLTCSRPLVLYSTRAAEFWSSWRLEILFFLKTREQGIRIV